MSILDAFYSLGKKINKSGGQFESSEIEEGIITEKFPELKLEMEDEDIIKLSNKWQKTWEESEVFSKWIEQSIDNENYWLGKHYQQLKSDKTRQLQDNIIFESLETYLPQVTRHNPDPMVTLARKEEQTEENLKYATELQKELGEIADELVLRLKLKKIARHWAVYLLGIAKLGWDLDRDIPTVKIIRPRKIILDPEATVDEDGYTGEFIGEHRKLQASILIEKLKENPKAEKIIRDIAKDSSGDEALGTDIGFIEWWTDQYMFWTLGKNVLLKKKNPYWNYDTEQEAPYNDQGLPQMDEQGKPLMDTVPGVNHLPVPRKPFIFLSVFNLGKQPIDDTSLIGQNLASQDLVNKRVIQIDKNADSMNGGMVVSMERSGLTKEQAKGVTEALRKGGTIVIPTGSVQEAITRMSAPGLPNDIYNQLQDTRNRMRDIFGTRGSSAAGLESETTVRGKLQNRMLDTDRIGGGFSEYLEQFADGIYNWFVQLLYVYDENYIGQPHPKVKISVKEGSLLPKDSMTIANQAIELAGAGKMSLIDLYKKLDYPNPEEMAVNVWLEINAPEVLFANDPRVQQVIQSRQNNTEQKPPSETISFRDLPPEGQAQMAKQAGIELNPEALAAFAQAQADKEQTKQLETQVLTHQQNMDKQIQGQGHQIEMQKVSKDTNNNK
jgi:hypothetical protein